MPPATDPHFKRNFTLGILNGALVNLGLAFIDPFTVLPVFIARLGGSGAMVGLATATYAAGWFLPQLFVAPWVETRRRVLGIYTSMAFVRVAAYSALVAAVFLVSPERNLLLITAVIGCFAITTVAAGVTGVPFLEVTSKSIPAEARSGFFGLRRLTGGALGILAGLVVAIVLGRSDDAFWARGPAFAAAERLLANVGLTGLPFPINYGVLFLFGTVFAALGYAVFAFFRESDGTVRAQRRSIREITTAGMSLLRRAENYRLFLMVRICWQFTAMAFPFYAMLAFTRLGFGEASAGLFVSLWVGAGVISNWVWGRLGDTKGNRAVLVSTAIMSIAPPVAMLVVLRELPGAERAPWVFALVTLSFVVNGFARSGRFIANMTYLLESVPQEGRPIYVGFMNTLSFPFMLSPVIGGLLVEFFSFEVLFVVSALAAIANTLLSWRLDEPGAQVAAEASVNMP
jgi:MFS family permease